MWSKTSYSGYKRPGGTDNEQQRTREDSATQPMDAGG